MKNWDELSETEKVAARAARIRSGHTSVGVYQRHLQLRAREDAFDEAIQFLASKGFLSASAALEEAAFEKAAP